MRNIQQFKDKQLSKFNQLILLNENGQIEESCDSIFSSKSIHNKSVLSWFPFLESIFPNILEMDINSPEIKFAKVETPLKELPGIYDFTFSRVAFEDKRPQILWSIYDYTKVYEDLIQFQQSRNELEILRETLERRNKQLKYQQDILAHENLLLGNINKLEKDYYQKVRMAVQSPVNVLDGLSFILSNIGNSKSEKDDYISALRSSVLHLQQIISEMEMVATEKIIDTATYIDVPKIITEVLDQIKITSDNNLVPVVNIDPTIHKDQLKGDPSYLKQIIYGLLINAYKYGQPSILKLHLSTQVQTPDITNLNLTITERLKLMPTQAQRGQDLITQMVIRLSLIKKIVEIQGGTIQVDTNTKQGIIINCLLPYSS